MSSSPRVAVVGGGVFGLACGIAMARWGALTTIYDPDPGGSASSVAAGMVAPWSEWLLDPVSSDLLEAMTAAHTLWPSFASMSGVDLDGGGTVHLGGEAVLEARLARLQAAGVDARMGEAALEGGSASPPLALHLPGERRIEPVAALAAMDRAFETAGGRRAAVRVVATPDGGLAAGGERLRADLVVLAPGVGGAALADAAPELAAQTSIKGQLLQLRGPPVAGPSVRVEGAYLAPQPGGVLVGATMVEGAADLVPDAAASKAFREAASRVWPSLADAPGADRVGVRVATPDGRPMVGWSSRLGVLIATGARRNGWLFAPLVAGMVAAYAAGRDPGPFASAFSPTRFAGPFR